MRRFLTACVVGLALIIPPYAALAGGKYYKGGYHAYSGYNYGHKFHGFKHRHHGHHRHGYYGDGLLIGLGIIGGSILLGSLLSRSAPPTTYYQQPRASYCVKDDVYRYLPDGSIQWGVRTRCY